MEWGGCCGWASSRVLWPCVGGLPFMRLCCWGLCGAVGGGAPPSKVAPIFSLRKSPRWLATTVSRPNSRGQAEHTPRRRPWKVRGRRGPAKHTAARTHTHTPRPTTPGTPPLYTYDVAIYPCTITPGWWSQQQCVCACVCVLRYHQRALSGAPSHPTPSHPEMAPLFPPPAAPHRLIWCGTTWA